MGFAVKSDDAQTISHAYDRMKEKEGARQQFEKVLTLEPTNSEEARYVERSAAWLAEEADN